MLLCLCLCFTACDSSVPEAVTPNKAPSFSMGRISGNTYRNDFLGLGCTIPQGWEIYSEKQLLEINNLQGESIDEEVLEQLKNSNLVFVLFAQQLNEGSSINVNMEKVAATQLLTLDIQQILEAQIPTIISTYQNIGYTNVEVNYQKTTIDGKELDSLYISAKINGMDFALVCFTFMKANYMVNVSVGTLQTENLNNLLGCFTIE